MTAQPTQKNWITMAIICLCIVGSVLTFSHFNRDLKGSTSGLFADQYTVETSNHGVKSYELNYSFDVNGKPYHGSDRMDTEPAAQKCTVYYDPSNPETNALKPNPIDPRASTLALVLIAVALIAYFFLPVHWPKPETETISFVEGGIGDAAGEYLTIEPGRYDGSVYVWVAFFGQMVLELLIAVPLVRTLLAGNPSADTVTAFVTFAVVSATFWIYWDRWKCTMVFASKFTSGCMNISLLYVPIVAIMYANYRGLMKLMGR